MNQIEKELIKDLYLPSSEVSGHHLRHSWGKPLYSFWARVFLWSIRIFPQLFLSLDSVILGYFKGLKEFGLLRWERKCYLLYFSGTFPTAYQFCLSWILPLVLYFTSHCHFEDHLGFLLCYLVGVLQFCLLHFSVWSVWY